MEPHGMRPLPRDEDDTTIINCDYCGDSRETECKECDGWGQDYEDGIRYELEGCEAPDCPECNGQGWTQCPECE